MLRGMRHSEKLEVVIAVRWKAGCRMDLAVECWSDSIEATRSVPKLGWGFVALDFRPPWMLGPSGCRQAGREALQLKSTNARIFFICVFLFSFALQQKSPTDGTRNKD